jgi:hypothetical protein
LYRHALVVSAVLFAHSALAADCLPYEPETVTLEGTVTRRVFPGPPNFDSVTAGDKKLVHWILRLKRPICVGSEKEADDLHEVEAEVLEVQIAPKDHRFYERNRRALGKRVRVTGTLFHQITAWHVTKVILQATDLEYPPAGGAGTAP